MDFDNTIKKDWFVLTNGSFWSSQPKDEREAKYFEFVKSEARGYGLKVREVWLNKTELEFHNRY